ncbi:DUF1513 domain-containing protein [Pseudorhodobacter sp.]|uniref:DUF1513 domain-containing protein n=1 Tax=Pseudorhodobacter sp. TaxID=1934400 RepID=UPI002AFE7EF4|nr:DUF1513 domain-containing protein [Pseudorhodobacter sp.]
MKLLSDGCLVVVNGGIVTDPSDRTKLNVDTMRPNLTVLADGVIVGQMKLAAEYHQNLICHLALLPDRTAFAMQSEGDPAEPVPLLGLWQPGQAARLCPAADAMKGHAGSIAATAGRIAVTSARVVWMIQAARLPAITARICPAWRRWGRGLS